MTSKIKILYEDKDMLAIEKPSGILVHPDKRSRDKTILDIFVKKYPRLEVVHRLDRETSGVMLLAKNQKAHEFLKKQFSAPALELKTKSGLADRQTRIKKIYIAIVSGRVKNDRGIINKSIGRSPKDFRRWLAGRGARGNLREAITEYKVLQRSKDFTYLEVRPKTGRTHQIRVHMKYLNHPIVCDALYNPRGACPKEIKRLALHAQSIIFRDMKGKEIKVESSLPKEFAKIMLK